MASLIFSNSGSSNGKQRWTKDQDTQLVAMVGESSTREEIAAATGHPANSITYRVRRIKEAEAECAKKFGEGVEYTLEDVLKFIKY